MYELSYAEYFEALSITDQEREKEEFSKNSGMKIHREFTRYKQKGGQKPISTGYGNIDTILGGGLYPGVYVMGAQSSMGKTTLLFNIAENISKSRKADVIYISLEMGRLELIAKSISRNTYEIDSKNAWNARQVLTNTIDEGTTADAANKKTLENMLNMFIFDGMGDISVTYTAETKKDSIEAILEKHSAFYPDNAKVLFIDYLQILQPIDNHMTDKQNTDYNIKQLNRLAREYNIPIIVISSLNRDSYNKGLSLASFKESGGIEYGADVLIVLQPAEEVESIDEFKRKADRKIEFKVLKSRLGELGNSQHKVTLMYHAPYNYFEFLPNPYETENRISAKELGL